MQQSKLCKKVAVTPKEAAQMYGLSEGTLANLRCRRLGAKFYRAGNKKILYFVSDLEDWLKRNPVLTKDSLPEH